MNPEINAPAAYLIDCLEASIRSCCAQAQCKAKMLAELEDVRKAVLLEQNKLLTAGWQIAREQIAAATGLTP